MMSREEPMEEQNRVNEEKDRNIQRQETKLATGREKVDEGAIRKMGTKGEIATKPNLEEEKDIKKRGTKKND